MKNFPLSQRLHLDFEEKSESQEVSSVCESEQFGASRNRLKLNLQVSEKAWKEYSRRTKEINESLNVSLSQPPPQPVHNLATLMKEIQSLIILPSVEDIVKMNKEIENENWAMGTKLEESYLESQRAVGDLENNLVAVLKYHERFFLSHIMGAKSKLENHDEKIKSLTFGFIETVNSRLAHLEFKLGGLNTFVRTLQHSLTKNKMELMDLETNYKEIITDKQYLSEKLDEGFELSKYLQAAVSTLTDSKEFFEKVAIVYQSRKSYEIFFEKIHFFETCLEELQKHVQQANPYKKKMEIIEGENLKLYQEIERLKAEMQKRSNKENVEAGESVYGTSLLMSPLVSLVKPSKYTKVSVADLSKVLPIRIAKILQKFEKNVNSKFVEKFEEGFNKLENMKMSLKRAKLYQVSAKKKTLELENKEKMYLKEINRLTNDNARLVGNLEEARGKLKAFSTENDELNEKIEKIFRELQIRNNEKSSLLAQKNEMVLKLSQCETEIKQLKKTNEKVFYEYEKITAENQQNQVKRQEVSSAYQTMEDRLRSQQEVIDQLKTENEILARRSDAHEKNAKTYHDALESFESRMKDMENNNHARLAEESSKFVDLKKVFDKTQKDLNISESMAKDLEVQNWNLDQKRLELEEKVEELKKDQERIRIESAEALDRAKELSRISPRRTRLEEMGKEAENLAKKNERLTKKLEKYRTGLSEKDKINEELSNVVERCLKELEMYQSKYNSYKSRTKNLKKSLFSIVSSTRSMHTTLKSSVQDSLSSCFSSLCSDVLRLFEPKLPSPRSRQSRHKHQKPENLFNKQL